MQLILREDVHNLGKSGELVNVKPGYGRNFLIPNGLAMQATTKNVAQLEHDKRLIAARNAKLMRSAQSIADRLSSLEIIIQRQSGEEDKIFGSVSSRDVEQALAEKGVQVDRRKIVLVETIKALGTYTVDIKLARDIVGKVKLWVVAKQ